MLSFVRFQGDRRPQLVQHDWSKGVSRSFDKLLSSVFIINNRLCWRWFKIEVISSLFFYYKIYICIYLPYWHIFMAFSSRHNVSLIVAMLKQKPCNQGWKYDHTKIFPTITSEVTCDKRRMNIIHAPYEHFCPVSEQLGLWRGLQADANPHLLLGWKHSGLLPVGSHHRLVG